MASCKPSKLKNRTVLEMSRQTEMVVQTSQRILFLSHDTCSTRICFDAMSSDGHKRSMLKSQVLHKLQVSSKNMS